MWVSGKGFICDQISVIEGRFWQLINHQTRTHPLLDDSFNVYKSSYPQEPGSQ